MPQNIIETKDLGFDYGAGWVFHKLNLEIAQGDYVVVIGANGAGKSTLLSMVSRLLSADTGEVLLDQNDVRHWKSDEFAKRVSILKQSNFMNVRLTVRELVSFGRFPYSKGRLTAEDKVQVDQALEYMNLAEMEDKFLDELSGGQRQRAFIAMVIAQDTDYVLLDEPLNNLDMKHSVQIMKILRKLVDELGKTVVIVLHDINFASVYSDRIVALKDGRVVKDGPTNDIINSDALKQIYDMDIPVQEQDGCRICVYFNSH